MNPGSTPASGRRVLHVLSQRPSLTGSGITLDALVRLAAEADWEQQAAVGVPAGGEPPMVGGLSPETIHALTFAGPDPIVDERRHALPQQPFLPAHRRAGG